MARFYGRYHALGFSISSDTLQLMRKLATSGELAHLSCERVWQESSRATMQVSPHIYWQTLFDIGALDDYFAPLGQAWQNTTVKETVQTALYFAGQMQLNLSQRWALLMASLDDALFHLKNDATTASKSISSLGQSAKVPKAHTQFASLFVEQAQQLNNIDELNSAQKIDLIQACSAHKAPEKISQLLATSQVLQLAIHHRQMMLALSSYHAIGMPDIAGDLKGPAIGAALRGARIQHLQAQDEQT